MKQSLKNAIPFAEAFARLLSPFAEVALHDLERDRIEAIYNPLSRRQVGDDSFLDRVQFGPSETVIGPYSKTNWDGRPLKSVSILLRNGEGVIEGFLCINIDLSLFDTAYCVLEKFLKGGLEPPEDSQRLFKDDLYERVNLYTQNYCLERGVSIEALSRREKQELICQLSDAGAFRGKNAAAYVGRVLGVSRATVYNYLKEKE